MLQKLRNHYFRKSSEGNRNVRRVGREHFIPLQPADLLRTLIALCPELSARQKSQWKTLYRYLSATFHSEVQRQLLRLRDLYLPLNPDRDTDPAPVQSSHAGWAIECTPNSSQLFEEFVLLLERANFRQLSQAEIESAIGNASEMGVRLHVDLDQFQRLAIFARGAAMVNFRKFQWAKLRYVEFEIPIYQRLVVVFQKRDEEQTVDTAYMRLFKNVPHADVDMTLPGGTVHISMLDRGKIILPTISGLGITVLKILKGAVILAFAGIAGLLAIAGLVAGAIGSGMKSFNGYWKTKNKYELSLTRNLYYQNLDNNEGVLYRLGAEAEAQELRETLLAYFVLWNAQESCSPGRLAAKAEQLMSRVGVAVDFEVGDAVAKLERLGLCKSDANGVCRAVTLDEAVDAVIERNLRYGIGDAQAMWDVADR